MLIFVHIDGEDKDVAEEVVFIIYVHTSKHAIAVVHMQSL